MEHVFKACPIGLSDFFSTYISKVPDGPILDLMDEQTAELEDFFARLTPEQANYRYAPDKWSVKEILGHLLDGERIFAYRALRFARNDITDLPGFDQDTYVAAGKFSDRTIQNLLDEFLPLRRSNTVLFRSLSEEMLNGSGTADGCTITVRALCYVIVGHVLHHREVLRDIYRLG